MRHCPGSEHAEGSGTRRRRQRSPTCTVAIGSDSRLSSFRLRHRCGKAQLKGEQVQPVSSYLPPESRIFFSSIAVYSFAAVF